MRYIVLFGSLLCLPACGGFSLGTPYWTKRPVPIPILAESTVADVVPFCGPMSQQYKRGGCFVEVNKSGVIYLQEQGALRPDIRLTAEQVACSLKHERKHSTHTHDNRPVWAFDCGD